VPAFAAFKQFCTVYRLTADDDGHPMIEFIVHRLAQA
jgi:hypothetical protein